MIMMPIMVIITVVMIVMMIVFVITLLIYYGQVTDAVFHPLNSLCVGGEEGQVALIQTCPRGSIVSL